MLLCVIRLSYGFRTKTARITGAKVASLTGMHKQHVSLAFKRLLEKNVIARDGKRIGLQKDWERWQTHEQKSQGPVTSELGLEDQTNKSNRRLLPKVTGGCDKLNSLKKHIKKEDVTSLRPPSTSDDEVTTSPPFREETLSSSPPDLPLAPSPALKGEDETQVRQLFAALKERRGWSTPKSAAEAKAIRWMLAQGYTPDDILSCYEDLKAKDFWKDKALFMMSVQKEIGEWKRRQAGQLEETVWRVR